MVNCRILDAAARNTRYPNSLIRPDTVPETVSPPDLTEAPKAVSSNFSSTPVEISTFFYQVANKVHYQ